MEHVMIVLVGLVILVAAVVAGAAGVLGNGGNAHALTHGFTALGYHVTGSAGTVFLYGITLGAIGLFGLMLLLAGARRTSRRGSAARRGLRQSRRETAVATQARDALIEQRATARANAANLAANPAARGDRHLSLDAARRGRLHLFGRRPAAAQSAADSQPAAGQSAADSQPAAGQSAADVPAPGPVS
jgi:hypothetical protein